MEHSNWLAAALVYLGAAIIAVPLAKKLGLGSIIGYLAAGIAIGPFGLGLVRDTESILHVAEFGVVLMLFLIGLELEPPRLWALRRPIFGWGSVQLLGCAAVLGGVALACGVSWPVAVVAALGLALSSTAVSLQVMHERNLLGTSGGQAGFAILLFQDVAAIPILALIPLLGTHAAAAGNPWVEALKAVGIPEKDIQTRTVGISKLDWGPRKGQFQASNVLAVTVRKVDAAGAAVTAAVRALTADDQVIVRTGNAARPPTGRHLLSRSDRTTRDQAAQPAR